MLNSQTPDKLKPLSVEIVETKVIGGIMQVANLDLCKELYGLSGWGNEVGAQLGHWRDPHNPRAEFEYYKYDLGYLMRKLPPRIELGNDPGCLALHSLASGRWVAQYDKRLVMPSYVLDANTPEDAVCRLAIELFKQNILTKEVA